VISAGAHAYASASEAVLKAPVSFKLRGLFIGQPTDFPVSVVLEKLLKKAAAPVFQ
jgi:hypothetical protein